MAQKIKKKIKHSLPGLLILILVCSLVVGFSFNLDSNLQTYLALAQNSDTATTQVQVRNAPPVFTIEPLESPVSSSTAPINYGDSISFSARASDAEGNGYYLAICSTNVINPVNGAAPTCGGTAYCISASTTPGTTASCTYSNVTLVAEQVDWYAFVCDNHLTEADCNPLPGHQNLGVDGGSPFFVNHNPTLLSVSTTDDNKDPGGAFTITADAYDMDLTAPDDMLTLYVCGTNSFATSSGCASGQELCHATSTATEDPSCVYNDVAPTPHGASANYFAFIMDWHWLAATNSPQQSTYTVNNVRPTLSGVFIDSHQGPNITLTMKGQAATIVYASSTSVGDNNGCTDLVGATSTIYMSSVAGGADCAHNQNNCYIATTSCVLSDCSGVNDALATYTCSSTLEHFTMSTDLAGGFNPRNLSNWLARLTVYDEALSTSSITTTGKDLNTLTAIDVTEPAIPYGIVKATFNTGAVDATTTVVNFGNGPLDSILTGTDMAGPGTIGVWMQQWATSTGGFVYPTGFYLTSTTTPTAGLVIPRPTDQTNVTDDVYWGIGIPGGTPSGTYNGINTFQASLNGNGNWN
jgi:hypothetical protein